MMTPFDQTDYLGVSSAYWVENRTTQVLEFVKVECAFKNGKQLSKATRNNPFEIVLQQLILGGALCKKKRNAGLEAPA
jgi:hypothetical protein